MRRTCFLSLAVLAACASSTASSDKSASPDARGRAQSIVDAPDRTDRDRALDPGRKPAEMLAFVQVSPGMHVGELGAGGGYTTELLARAVAPGGVVYAQNPPAFVQGFLKEVWPARLSRPAMKDVVRVDRDFDDPFPPEAKDLDRVVMNVIYHDTTYMGVDRDKMNRAVFAALKPGGEFILVDSSAKPGTGADDAKTLHRIDEQFVKDEVLKAGFKLQAEGDFLRNPQDARDWNSSPPAAGERRGTSDRFALRFVKP
jgi:predicted methyltransferase